MTTYMSRIHKSNMVLNIFVLVTIIAEVMVAENSKMEKVDKLSKRKVYEEGEEYLKAHLKGASSSSCFHFWSSSSPPNTLISYSQRPVWHDRPLTPQMAAL